MKPETTVDLTEIQPDALITGERQTEIAPLAGRPVEQGYYVETLRLARYNKIVTITVVGVGPFDGDVMPFIGADAEAAEVHFIRVREELRRDGWNLTEVPTATTEHAPF